MPYDWVEPILVFKYFGVSIFHTYNDGMLKQPRMFHFTTCNFNDETEYQFDARELDEWREYIMAHGKIKENGTYESHMHNVIKMAIERQTLVMPTPYLRYAVKRGCFEWYYTHPNDFINSLAGAVIAAALNNKERLNKIYRHMIYSNSVGDWLLLCHGDVVDAPILPVFRVSNREEKNPCNGSFFWHLNRSGSFVAHMANVILHADIKNIEAIRQVYPQMIAAFELRDWNEKPSGFKPVYDARPE